MKISPAPNFGSYGAYIDDVDMNTMTDDEWKEIGKIFLEKLVVVFRRINMSREQYLDWMYKWGPQKANIRGYFKKKYGENFDAIDRETWEKANLTDRDRSWLDTRGNQLETLPDGRKLTRIYGQKDENGNMLGYFSTGYLNWHSNEVSTLTHSPAVAFFGWQNMQTSATGFLQTANIYENLSESFRSELDQMVMVHKFKPGKTNDSEAKDEAFSLHVQMAFCPEDNVETPLVCTSPGGHRGIHYSLNTRHAIKGMSESDSNKVFEELDRLIFKEENIWNHWYQNDGDLCVFDNSITMHHRIGGVPDRLGFRTQFDVSDLLDKPWLPWQHLPKYNTRYINEIRDLVHTVGGELEERFKLP